MSIALHMLNDAYKDEFDQAFLISNDSGLVPVIRMLADEFPKKTIRILTPPKRRTSTVLVKGAGGFSHVRTIKPRHLRKSLLPRKLTDKSGRSATRPAGYDPPP